MSVKLQALTEQLEDEQAMRRELNKENKSQREEVEAAHATHARLFQLQQSLNDAYAENAELRAQYDAVKQELAFSALTNGGVDQELFDGGNLMMSDSISPQASPRRSREMMSSQSPDAYDAYVENSELRSQLKMVKRQLMQAISEFEMNCEIQHATQLGNQRDARDVASQLRTCEKDKDKLEDELDQNKLELDLCRRELEHVRSEIAFVRSQRTSTIRGPMLVQVMLAVFARARRLALSVGMHRWHCVLLENE